MHSVTNHPAGSPATLFLRTGEPGSGDQIHCEVLRITPGTISLEVEAPGASGDDAALFWANRDTEVLLPLPRPHAPVRTRVRLDAMSITYLETGAIYRFELTFMELTEDEEEAIRDSHPRLVAGF